MTALQDRLQTLPAEHRRALEWFEDQRGELIGWPDPLDGLFLVNRPKGIHKPKGWTHTLSVRQSLKGPYADRPPVGPVDGAWIYEYFQEGQDPAERDSYATNRGLMACALDDVPVAVLIQERGRPNVQYRVWGLAKVVGWHEGLFTLQAYDAAREAQPIPANDPDLFYSLPTSAYGGMAEPGLPLNVEDARKRIEAQIVVRQGGAKFRREALKSFGGRCAISGWDVEEVLEAAHIVPHRGPQTDLADNALLLRADLHTLFDQKLLHIDPDSRRIVLAPNLLNSPYGAFSGQEVRLAEGVSAETFKGRLQQRIEQLKPATS